MGQLLEVGFGNAWNGKGEKGNGVGGTKDPKGKGVEKTGHESKGAMETNGGRGQGKGNTNEGRDEGSNRWARIWPIDEPDRWAKKSVAESATQTVDLSSTRLQPSVLHDVLLRDINTQHPRYD